MKQYPEYKPSGIDWIGDIPSHWQVIRIKHAYKFQTGATPPTKITRFFEGDLPWATIADLKQKTISETETYLTKEGVSVCSMDISPKDSLLYSFKLSVGTVAFCGVDMYTNEAIATFLKGKNSLRYLYYTAPLYIIHNANYNIYGAPLLRQQLIKDAITVLPPLAEQEAIADFLDKKCGDINSLIEKQQRRIALLDELRQTTITKAVTRGLKPDTPLRSSGIDWLGQIPKHWKLRKLKFICRNEQYNIKTGPFGTQLKGDDLKEEGDVCVYNQRNVIDNNFEKVKSYVTFQKASSLKSFYTRPGDLLITSRGTIGKAALLPSDIQMGILHPCLIAVRYNSEIVNSKYLLYYINYYDGFKTSIQLASNATTIEVIYTETLKNIFLTLPPLPEQEAIINFLDTECSKIDKQITRIKREIELLEEYKQSVIAEVVTGKRRVFDIETPSIIYETEPHYTPSIAAEP